VSARTPATRRNRSPALVVASASAWPSSSQVDGALGVCLLPFGLAAASAVADATLTGGACGVASVSAALGSALQPSVPLAVGTLVAGLTTLEWKAVCEAAKTPVVGVLAGLAAAAALGWLFVNTQLPLWQATLAHKAVAGLLKPSVGLALGVAAAVVAIVEAPALGALFASALPAAGDAVALALLALLAVRTAIGPGAEAVAHYQAQAASRAAAQAAAVEAAKVAAEAEAAKAAAAAEEVLVTHAVAQLAVATDVAPVAVEAPAAAQ
jgi:hypothetical protein